MNNWEDPGRPLGFCSSWRGRGILSCLTSESDTNGQPREAFGGDEEEKHSGDPSRGFSLIILATATSIDALAVGLSFSMAGVSVWGPAIIIGLVCAVLTALGIKLGSSLGRSDILGGKASIVGAFVLIGIGVKILYEHGVF